jgi:hypothetical protein
MAPCLNWPKFNRSLKETQRDGRDENDKKYNSVHTTAIRIHSGIKQQEKLKSL